MMTRYDDSMMTYQAINPEPPPKELLSTTTCLYCGHALREIGSDPLSLSASVCQRCGWWIGSYSYEFEDEEACMFGHRTDGASGAPHVCDVTDLHTPLQEIRDYLAAKYSKRQDVHPRLFENVVGSVFTNLGYQTLVTGYSNDGGIDIFLDKDGVNTVGVQVKRTKRMITAEQIRAFTGALFLKSLRKGVYVTTSNYQPGARKAATLAALRGMAVELLDADRFFDALSSAQQQVDRVDERWIRTRLSQFHLISDDTSFWSPSPT